jgi:hypothetical protein
MLVLQWWTGLRQEVLECPQINFFSLPNIFLNLGISKNIYKNLKIPKIINFQ